MDQERFGQFTKALATGTHRRTVTGRLGGVLGSALGLGEIGALAAPPGGNLTEWYGVNSLCPNGK